ncbi:MAG: acetate kinase [Erysipelotrichales bacterium]|nr:acetate kinase [Erysipelotrichales bacterium]MBQ4375360.1 acetate kinase [Erysipelotrichales bacterium]
MPKVMSVNAGSSSLKFSLFQMPEETVLTSGVFEKIGLPMGIFTIRVNGEKITKELELKDHNIAVQILLKALVDYNIVKSIDEIDAVGHRVLHGGEIYATSAIFNDKVVQDIKDLTELGPLHMPANLMGYEVFHAALPNAGQVAVFDTSFHQTMPPEVFLYPVPYEWYKKYRVRRYGFHGTSHKYVSRRVAELMGRKVEDLNIITCHLGNGASLCAVKGGKSYDTSMGFTPLAGIMMGARSGDIDPSVLSFIEEKTGMSPSEMTNTLNRKSGMLGISGVSSDARDIQKAIDEGNERAILCREMYAVRLTETIGGYYALLGHVDAIVFTAGLGENDVKVRAEALDMVKEALGIEYDAELNARSRGKEVKISTPNSKIEVWIVPTNEELVIARDTVELLGL